RTRSRRTTAASAAAAVAAVARTVDDVLTSVTDAIDDSAGRLLLQAQHVIAPSAPEPVREVRLPEGVERFRPASSEARRPREILDRTTAEAREQIREQVRDVLRAEGPVTVDRLVKIVAARFGLSKLHTTRRDYLRGLVPHGVAVVAPNGDVVAWPKGITPDNYTGYRVPEPGGQRDIADVPYHELRNALVQVVRSAHGIGEDDALRETARQFGVHRVATKIRERLQG